MRVFLALLLAAVLMLSGCVSVSLTPVQEAGEVDLPMPVEEIPAAPTGDSRAQSQAQLTLYYIGADQQQLAKRTRSVTLSGDETLAEKAIERLLAFEETEPSLKRVAPEGTRLSWLQQSQGIVTLSLTTDALALEAPELCWMDAAIANTLTSLPGVNYVNVLIDNEEESAMMIPTGTLSHSELSLTALVAQQESDVDRFDRDPATAQIERDVTLYFGGWQDDQLVPEVRRVTLDTHELALVLIDALKQGPQMTAQAHGVLPVDAQLMYDAETDTLDDGRRVLKLAFNGDLRSQLERDGFSQWQMYGALTLTLCRFIPELDGLMVWIDDQLVMDCPDGTARHAFPDGVITPDMFDGMIGRVATLYFADSDGAMCTVERLMDLQSAVSPRALLDQLIEGPAVFDAGGEARPVMPDGVTDADVLGIRIEDRTALVNLSSNFYRLCQSMTPDQERNLVYGMVNTLCELDRVDRVRFYVAGAVVDTLLKSIYIRGPLLPNAAARRAS